MSQKLGGGGEFGMLCGHFCNNYRDAMHSKLRLVVTKINTKFEVHRAILICLNKNRIFAYH